MSRWLRRGYVHESKGGQHGLVIILMLGLGLRVLFPVVGYLTSKNPAIFYNSDTETYIAPARELIARGRFFVSGEPEIIRTPGYPFLLTIPILFGHVTIITIIIQILLSCFTVYLVHRTALMIFGREWIAVVAAILCAVEPLSILYTSALLTETLFATLTLLWLYLLIRYLKQRSLRCLLLAATVLAASVYVRPGAYFMPPLIGLGLLTYSLISAGHAVDVLSFIAISAALIAPWQLRNRLEAGYAGFSGISSRDIYFFAGAAVTALHEHIPLGVVQDRLGYDSDYAYVEHHPEQKAWNLARRLSYMDHEGANIVLGNLATYALIHLIGVGRVLVGTSSTEFLQFFGLPLSRGVPFLLVNLLLAVLELPYLILCVTTCLHRVLRREPVILATATTIAYYAVVSGGPMGYSRYRVPVMPEICILAAYSACMIMPRRKSKTPMEFRRGSIQPRIYEPRPKSNAAGVQLMPSNSLIRVAGLPLASAELSSF
jgi:4-amino-4-deoxy-L-arabinose transferase-like glycosyltransferase